MKLYPTTSLQTLNSFLSNFSFFTSYALIFGHAVGVSEHIGVAISQSATSFRQLGLSVPTHM